MFGKHLWIAVLTVMTMLAASAVAQDEKNELGGTLGRTFISNQGIKGGIFPNTIIAFGNGLSFDVEYGHRFMVTPVWSISGEVVMMVNHDEDINGGAYLFAVVPTQISQFFVTPGVRLNLFPVSHDRRLSVDQPWRWLRPLQSKLDAGLWRQQPWQEHHFRRVARWIWAGCESLA